MLAKTERDKQDSSYSVFSPPQNTGGRGDLERQNNKKIKVWHQAVGGNWLAGRADVRCCARLLAAHPTPHSQLSQVESKSILRPCKTQAEGVCQAWSWQTKQNKHQSSWNFKYAQAGDIIVLGSFVSTYNHNPCKRECQPSVFGYSGDVKWKQHRFHKMNIDASAAANISSLVSRFATTSLCLFTLILFTFRGYFSKESRGRGNWPQHGMQILNFYIKKCGFKKMWFQNNLLTCIKQPLPQLPC